MCTKKSCSFAIIGHPIGHTMSPFIHKRLFCLSGTDSQPYEVMDIAPENLKESMKSLRCLRGFNVTIPHKQAIIPLLDECSPQARAFGSVNTVSIENGKAIGYTTDGIGCLKALQAFGVQPDGACLLLGSGGAARAVAFALTEACREPQITFAVREHSFANAKELCNSLSEYALQLGKRGHFHVVSYTQLENDAQSPSASQFHLLLNCTSVGMYPAITDCPVSAQVVARCDAVFDAVYNPHETRLLQIAQELGIPAIHGMAMLVWQAAAAQEIWNGFSFRPEDMEKLVCDTVEEMEKNFGRK